MNNKEVGMVLNGVFLVVLVAGVLISIFYFSNNGAGKKTLEDCEKISDNEERLSCYINVAGKNVQLCNQIPINNTRKVSCIVAIAADMKKPSLCDIALDNKSQNQCYVGYAVRTGSRDNCEKVPDDRYRQYCYSNINN